jgi:ABC-type multidrug transport system fused ATPase/permease subunit
MKFEQSFAQSVFDRFYRSIGNAIVYFGIVLIISTIYQTPSDSQLPLIVILLFPLVVTLWLLIFNRGEGKVETFSITIKEEGITIRTYGNLKEVSWDSFTGFKISRWFPKSVKILRIQKENIEFSYYALSSDQRSELFEILRSKES